MVGLGNPGKSYENTRHNIGFMVVDRISHAHRLKFKKRPLFSCAEFQDSGVDLALVKPATFMNQSGEAVRECLNCFPGLSLGRILVIMDDVNLPLGKIRLRVKGTAGGHHGLESIIRETGSSQFARLRIGVGCEGLSGKDLTDYVLGSFRKNEQDLLKEVLNRSEKACLDWSVKGSLAAMNLHNRNESN